MPDPCTIRFQNYYEAQLAVHQVEADGHRAQVHEYIYGLGAWPGSQFRMVVFKGGLSGEPKADGTEPTFGEFDSGALVRGVDSLLRFLTVAILCAGSVIALLVPFSFVEQIAAMRAETILGALVVTCFSAVILIGGMRFTLAAYDGYRANDPFWVGLIRLGAGGSLAAYLLPLFLSPSLPGIVGVVFLLIFLTDVHCTELAQPPPDEADEDDVPPGSGS